MSDLISREAAIEAIEELKNRYLDRKVVLAKAQDAVNNLPTISPKTGYIEFAEWVAEEVMREDFGDGFFAEAACRKLYRLGIITMDGDKWKLEREEVTE